MAIKTKFAHEAFKVRVKKKMQDSFMRGAVASATDTINGRKVQLIEDMGNWEDLRSHGEEIRRHVLENLDYYLYQFSENVAKNGGHVYFAATAQDANEYIREVVKKKNAKKVIKAKSMVTEEIGMNDSLEAIGCEVVESDLGEFILQLDDKEPPSHIVVPTLHKNKEQMREVFERKLDYKGSSQPEELAGCARRVLREKFLAADVGVIGCNFAVAETGSTTLVTNEGNADLVADLPETLIVCVGMERLVPTFEEMDALVALLTTSAVGQKLTSYVTNLTGPRREGDVDGPEEFHVVIVDNGRSNILGTQFQPVLQCIRCAACINNCPVYRHIGGHAYGSIYPGPIGITLTPLLDGYEDNKELPYACTLCGACTEVCPVKIPLHDLIRTHRQVIVEKEGKVPFSEKMMMKAFGIGTSNFSLYNMASRMAHGVTKPLASNGRISKGIGPLKEWTDYKDLPTPNKERFRDWFKRHKAQQGGSK